MKTAALIFLTFFSVLLYPPKDFAEAKGDSTLENIEVFNANATPIPLRENELTLFNDKKTGQPVTLKTLDAPQTTLSKQVSELSPHIGSTYAGAELRFNLSNSNSRPTKPSPNSTSK